jgi:hypothetical protein
MGKYPIAEQASILKSGLGSLYPSRMHNPSERSWEITAEKANGKRQSEKLSFGRENKRIMKMRNILAVGVVLMLTGVGVRAAHVWEDPNGWWVGHFSYDTAGTPRYTEAELSFDAFGSYVAGERRFSKLFETDIKHGTWGGGVGLNYFFTRYLGLGGDINIPANGGNFVDQFEGSLIARWPFEPSGWSPYIFGGGGRSTDPDWEWIVHGGVGVEYRFNPTTGIFMDGRYIWHVRDGSTDRILFRAGLKFVF